MKVFIALFLFPIFLWAKPPILVETKPLLTAEKIDAVKVELKKQKNIPDQAIDKVFDFYSKNRKTTGGLTDPACLEKKGYKIRAQDPKQKKKDLFLGILNESCVCVADFTKAKTEKRGFCIFLNAEGIEKIETFPLAHGSGSLEKTECPPRLRTS